MKKFWIIDKDDDFAITGPYDLNYIRANVTNSDFHLVVAGCEIDVKAQFTPTQKEDLFFKLKNSRNYPLNIESAIFWALPGNKKPKAARRAPVAADSTTLDEIYQQASEVLGEPEKTLRDRYAHLGAGLQSMNLRNRMRRYE